MRIVGLKYGKSLYTKVVVTNELYGIKLISIIQCVKENESRVFLILQPYHTSRNTKTAEECKRYKAVKDSRNDVTQELNKG